MSSLSEKLDPVRVSGSGRANAKLHHLQSRKGYQESADKKPRVVIVRAPSQTEWWVWVGGENYELDRVVAESAKPLLREGSAE